MNIPDKLMAFPMLFALTGPVLAEGEGFNVSVGRDYTVDANIGTATSVALGKNAAAELNVGGVQVRNTSLRLGRDYRTNVQTGSVTAVDLGFIGTGPINLGGVQALQ